jgi:hypothetical protein
MLEKLTNIYNYYMKYYKQKFNFKSNLNNKKKLMYNPWSFDGDVYKIYYNIEVIESVTYCFISLPGNLSLREEDYLSSDRYEDLNNSDFYKLEKSSLNQDQINGLDILLQDIIVLNLTEDKLALADFISKLTQHLNEHMFKNKDKKSLLFYTRCDQKITNLKLLIYIENVLSSDVKYVSNNDNKWNLLSFNYNDIYIKFLNLNFFFYEDTDYYLKITNIGKFLFLNKESLRIKTEEISYEYVYDKLHNPKIHCLLWLWLVNHLAKIYNDELNLDIFNFNSISSVFFYYFRRENKSILHKIPIDYNEEELLIFRCSFKAGILDTEYTNEPESIFDFNQKSDIRDTLPNIVYKYDKVAAYSEAAANGLFPVTKGCLVDNYDLNVPQENNFKAFLFVKIITKDNLYIPVQVPGDDRVYYPIGTVFGWYFSDEIYQLISLGAEVFVIKAYVWDVEFENLFSDFINKTYFLRKNTQNELFSTSLKQGLNSFLGKWSQKKNSIKKIIYNCKEKPVEASKEITYNIIENSEGLYTKVINEFTKTSAHYGICNGSIITAKNRMHLRSIICNLKNEYPDIEFYHINTDGFYCNKLIPKFINKEKILGNFRFIEQGRIIFFNLRCMLFWDQEKLLLNNYWINGFDLINKYIRERVLTTRYEDFFCHSFKKRNQLLKQKLDNYYLNLEEMFTDDFLNNELLKFDKSFNFKKSKIKLKTSKIKSKIEIFNNNNDNEEITQENLLDKKDSIKNKNKDKTRITNRNDTNVVITKLVNNINSNVNNLEGKFQAHTNMFFDGETDSIVKLLEDEKFLFIDEFGNSIKFDIKKISLEIHVKQIYQKTNDVIDDYFYPINFSDKNKSNYYLKKTQAILNNYIEAYKNNNNNIIIELDIWYSNIYIKTYILYEETYE